MTTGSLASPIRMFWRGLSVLFATGTPSVPDGTKRTTVFLVTNNYGGVKAERNSLRESRITRSRLKLRRNPNTLGT
jgi:hypothetical protein